jgi:hypothetical protein
MRNVNGMTLRAQRCILCGSGTQKMATQDKKSPSLATCPQTARHHCNIWHSHFTHLCQPWSTGMTEKKWEWPRF